MTNISNQLCTRNLEIIYGNKKKSWPKKLIFTSPGNFLTFSKIHLVPKVIQLHLDIDKLGKCSIPVLYIDGIISALCALVFD